MNNTEKFYLGTESTIMRLDVCTMTDKCVLCIQMEKVVVDELVCNSV